MKKRWIEKINPNNAFAADFETGADEKWAAFHQL